MIENEAEASAGVSIFDADKIHLLGTIWSFDGDHYDVAVETPFLVANFRVRQQDMEFNEPDHQNPLGTKAILVLR